MSFRFPGWLVLMVGSLSIAQAVWAGARTDDEAALKCLKDLDRSGDADAVVTGIEPEKAPLVIPVRPFKTHAPGPRKFYVVTYAKGVADARVVELKDSTFQFRLEGFSGVFE